MTSAQVLAIAAQRGHRVQIDPPAAITATRRWTCPCGRAALLSGSGIAHGSALTENCELATDDEPST